MKILLFAVIGLVAILLAVAATGITDAVTDFRTDELAEEFVGDTAVGVTSTNVQLGSELWDDSLSYASVATNATADAPALTSYNGTNRQVTVTGLAANTTRTITLTYRTAGLSDYSGAEEISLNIPVIILVFIILLPASGIIALIVWAIKRNN